MKTIKVKSVAIILNKAMSDLYGGTRYDIYVEGADNNIYFFRSILRMNAATREELHRLASTCKLFIWKRRTNRARKRGGANKITIMALTRADNPNPFTAVATSSYKKLSNFKKSDIFEDLFDQAYPEKTV